MSNATQPQYREVKRKANVGERIKIVNAQLSGNRYANGVELLVKRVRMVNGEQRGVYSNTRGGEAYIYDDEYVVLEPVASLAATLPDLFAQFIRDNASAVRSYLAEIDPVDSAEPNVSDPQPAPLTRAKVIEMARDKVAELERIGRDDGARLDGSSKFYDDYYVIEYVVNRDKRVVTALAHYVNYLGDKIPGRKVAAVGIAKAAPDDVFNADIGKAIAAERALGLTLTDAFVNAPKPEKAVSGTIVKRKSPLCDDGIRTITRRHETITDGCWFSTGYWDYASTFAIIDDTDAIYTQEDGEAA